MLYSYNDVVNMHLELTDKCNAGCPMCPRYIDQGSKLNPNLSLSEITVEQFKTWFPVDFVARLQRVYACGNYGDPIAARDCLEIYEYLRENNSTVSLTIHTNGAARNTDWWARLAKVITRSSRNDYCVFSVDGLADTNHLYRRGTSFNKIIENAKAFIDAGGAAKWDFIVFRHNEHQVEEARQLAKDMGFLDFNIKKTTRWRSYDSDGLGEYPVKNKDDLVTHILQQPIQEEYQHKNITTLKKDSQLALKQTEAAPHLEIKDDIVDERSTFPLKFSSDEFRINREKFKEMHNQLPKATLQDIKKEPQYYSGQMFDKDAKQNLKFDIRDIDIACRAQDVSKGGTNAGNEIFVNTDGYIFPCCFLAGEPWKTHNTDSDGRSSDVFMQLLDMAGGLDSISLKNHTLQEILDTNRIFTEYIEYNFQTGQDVRSKQCALCCGKDWNILDNGELGNEEYFKEQKRKRQNAS